jgi:hypothetical protein
MKDINSIVDNIQGQYALKSLNLNLQQIYNTALATKQAINNSRVDAARQAYLSQIANLAAVNSHKETLKATRYTLNYENQISDRNILALKQTASSIKQTLVYNTGILQNLKESKVGSQMAQTAGSGVIANQGSAKDLILQTINESDKEIASNMRSATSDISQVYENALSQEIAKSFNNWQVETQIEYSGQVLKNNLIQ